MKYASLLIVLVGCVLHEQGFALQRAATLLKRSFSSPIYLTPQTKPISSLSSQQGVHYHILAILTTASIFTNPNSLTGIMSPLVFTNALDVLRSAARRDRLDGGTFKLLNLGVSLTFAGSLLTLVQKAMLELSSLIICLAVVNVYGLGTAVSSLRRFGMPKLKLNFPNALSTTYFVTIIVYLFLNF
jgi:hypothetical protein